MNGSVVLVCLDLARLRGERIHIGLKSLGAMALKQPNRVSKFYCYSSVDDVRALCSNILTWVVMLGPILLLIIFQLPAHYTARKY